MTGAGVTGLADFVPEARLVAVGEDQIEVRPLTIGQLPGFSRAVTPILPGLLSGQIMPVLMADPEALFEAVAISTGWPLARLHAMDPVAFVALAQAVIEVNVDFFARRLLPAARAAEQAILTRMVALAPPAGD